MNQEINDIPQELLDNDEDLLKFLRGELSKDDEAAFLQKLQQNPDLKARAIAVARLIKGLERKGVETDEQLKSSFKNLSPEDFKPKTINIKRIITWVVSAAAVLVLVFGLRMFYVNSSYDKLAAEYESVFNYSDLSRGSDDNMESKVKTLCDNVLQDNDLESTINSLAEIFAKSQSETFNECTNYFATSGWYLSLAHLKKHDPEKAKSVLTILAANSEDYPTVAAKAKELLEKL